MSGERRGGAFEGGADPVTDPVADLCTDARPDSDPDPGTDSWAEARAWIGSEAVAGACDAGHGDT